MSIYHFGSLRLIQFHIHTLFHTYITHTLSHTNTFTHTHTHTHTHTQVSLGIFQPTSSIRGFLHAIVSSNVFDGFIIACILVTMVLLAMDSPDMTDQVSVGVCVCLCPCVHVCVYV
jgi:hypothetical protein